MHSGPPSGAARWRILVDMNNQSLPGAWALVKEGYALYHARLNVIIKIVWAQLGSLVVVYLVGAIAAITALAAVAASMHASKVVLALSICVIAVIVAAVIVAACWLLSWVQLAFMHAIRGHAEGVGFSTAFHRARPQVWSLIWIGILMALVGLLALIVGGLLPGGVVFGVLYALLGMRMAAIAGLVIGIIGAVIVCVLVSIWYAFSSWVLVDGNTRGRSALRASHSLIRGRFWRVFGRFLLIGICFGVASIVLSVVAALVFSVFGHTAGTILHGIVSVLAGVFFFTPVSTAACYVLYNALRSAPSA